MLFSGATRLGRGGRGSGGGRGGGRGGGGGGEGALGGIWVGGKSVLWRGG